MRHLQRYKHDWWFIAYLYFQNGFILLSPMIILILGHSAYPGVDLYSILFTVESLSLLYLL